MKKPIQISPDVDVITWFPPRAPRPADATGSSSLGLLHEESLASRRKGVVGAGWNLNKITPNWKKEQHLKLNQSSMTLGLHVHKFRVKNTWWCFWVRFGGWWLFVVVCWFWVGCGSRESFPKPNFWSWAKNPQANQTWNKDEQKTKHIQLTCHTLVRVPWWFLSSLGDFLCVFVSTICSATNREPGEQKNQVGVNMTFKASICIGIQFLGFLFWVVVVFSRSWTGSRLVNLDFVRHKITWFRAHLKNVHLDVCRVLHTSVLEGNAAMPFKTWAAHMFIFSLVCQGDWVISLTN